MALLAPAGRLVARVWGLSVYGQVVGGGCLNRPVVARSWAFRRRCCRVETGIGSLRIGALALELGTFEHLAPLFVA